MSYEHDNKKSSLCSPFRNTDFESSILDSKNIENLYSKMENCGKESITFVNKYSSELLELPAYCDNRCCQNRNCQKHRGYKFKKKHFNQIIGIQESIKKPKAWVFTNQKIPLIDIRKIFYKEKIRLYNLLKNFSVSSFSMHVEIKLYPIRYTEGFCDKCINYRVDCQESCRFYGLGFLHFHVVSGGIRNLKLVRKIWRYHISNEPAIIEEKLVKYVSKYASKTPFFAFSVDMELYHLLVYKRKMHYFYIKGNQEFNLKVESDWIPYSLLEWEVYQSNKRDFERTRRYHPYIEKYELSKGIRKPKRKINHCLEEFL